MSGAGVGEPLYAHHIPRHSRLEFLPEEPIEQIEARGRTETNCTHTHICFNKPPINSHAPAPFEGVDDIDTTVV